MVIDLSRRKSDPHVWCRFCGAHAWLDNGDARQEYIRSALPKSAEPTLDEEIVRKLVSDLNQHRLFFYERGLSDETIARYKLGYHAKYRRYAIPCYFNGKLYGVKYRIDPENERRMKAAGETYAKYISEKGGVNNVVFNDVVARAPVPYVLIDEGELDALLLTQLGFPTISPFSGNNSKVGWRPEWRSLIRHIPSVYVVVQNDEPGELIGIARLHDLGRGAVVRPPDGFKDLGEWIRSIPQDKREGELVKLLRLPPVRNIYG